MRHRITVPRSPAIKPDLAKTICRATFMHASTFFRLHGSLVGCVFSKYFTHLDRSECEVFFLRVALWTEWWVAYVEAVDTEEPIEVPLVTRVCEWSCVSINTIIIEIGCSFLSPKNNTKLQQQQQQQQRQR